MNVSRTFQHRSVIGVGAKVSLAALILTGLRTSQALGDGPATAPTPVVSDRYGPLNWLDDRSAYGQGAYPEPFLVDDSDLEVNEARIDWLHTEGHGQNTDLITGEVEKGFGLLTLELEAPFERDTTLDVDPATGQTSHTYQQGLGNVSLGARFPIYQWVSSDETIDTTFGAAAEVGIPTNSAVSKDTEIVPKLFEDVKLGDHFTIQSILGYSSLLGSDGDLKNFEYGFVFGYTIPHVQLPLPDVEQLIPILELQGDTQLNKADAGQDSLLGNLGFRLNLKPIGPLQPRLGMGYVFPLDRGGREDLHWGIVTSLVFEY